jgi:Ner family transcriptional regulator
MAAKDWHREQIMAAIRMRGTTGVQLSVGAGYSPNSVHVALSRPWPAVEAIIAQFIGTRPQLIWPSRYDADGVPLRGRAAVASWKPSRAAQPQSRQKRASA